MASKKHPLALSSVLLLLFTLNTLAQRPTRPRPRATPPPVATEETVPGEPQDKDIETLKTDTNLVMVPVIATDRSGIYVPDILKEEFTLAEDNVSQQIAFFAKVSAPFHVVLMLDTSASTQDKLSLIQQAAFTFVQQLQPADRVKIISFDDQVRDLNDFTSDRSILKASINKTKSGQGTKIYDAIATALSSVRTIKGRKAIVIFTDGVDWHSDTQTYESTARWLDEEGVIVYPIRYDTRAATERIAREQSEGISPTTATTDILRPVGVGASIPTGTTPKTFPSDDPIPNGGSSSKTGPLGLPSASEILRRKREEERERDRTSQPGSPPGGLPGPTTRPDADRPPIGTRRSRVPRQEDSITATLDMAYMTADNYLNNLAEKSGGRLLRADTLDSLPDAFAKIAAELRTQYSLGYYPTNKDRDDRYRKIKVASTRKDVVIRSRPGYLATDSK